MTEYDVYQFYNNIVKILYSEIEARNNTLPVELLFETYSAFDHLKRFHLSQDTEDECAKKAFSHLKRGALDALKLKLKYFNAEYNKLLSKKSDLKIIDSGQYLPKLLGARKEITKKAKEARISESYQDIEMAFEKWYEVSDLINNFEEEYFNSEKIQWATIQKYFHFSGEFITGLVTGILASIIVASVPAVFKLISSLVMK